MDLLIRRLQPGLILAVLCLMLTVGQLAAAPAILPNVDLAAQALPDGTIKLSWKEPKSEVEFVIIRSKADGSVAMPLPISWKDGVPGFGPDPGIIQSFIDREVAPQTAYKYQVRSPNVDEGTWETVTVTSAKIAMAPTKPKPSPTFQIFRNSDCDANLYTWNCFRLTEHFDWRRYLRENSGDIGPDGPIFHAH